VPGIDWGSSDPLFRKGIMDFVKILLDKIITIGSGIFVFLILVFLGTKFIMAVASAVGYFWAFGILFGILAFIIILGAAIIEYTIKIGGL
jgi:hypothetical protein